MVVCVAWATYKSVCCAFPLFPFPIHTAIIFINIIALARLGTCISIILSKIQCPVLVFRMCQSYSSTRPSKYITSNTDDMQQNTTSHHLSQFKPVKWKERERERMIWKARLSLKNQYCTWNVKAFLINIDYQGFQNTPNSNDKINKPSVQTKPCTSTNIPSPRTKTLHQYTQGRWPVFWRGG